MLRNHSALAVPYLTAFAVDLLDEYKALPSPLTSRAPRSDHPPNSRTRSRIQLVRILQRRTRRPIPQAMMHTGKNSGIPFSANARLRSSHLTPDWTITSESAPRYVNLWLSILMYCTHHVFPESCSCLTCQYRYLPVNLCTAIVRRVAILRSLSAYTAIVPF
jgi:hypothetical protein